MLFRSSLSHVQLFETPRTAACQAPLSVGFCRQEYWSGPGVQSLPSVWEGPLGSSCPLPCFPGSVSEPSFSSQLFPHCGAWLCSGGQHWWWVRLCEDLGLSGPGHEHRAGAGLTEPLAPLMASLAFLSEPAWLMRAPSSQVQCSQALGSLCFLKAAESSLG